MLVFSGFSLKRKEIEVFKKGKRPLSSSNTPKHPRLLRDEGKVLLFLYLGKGMCKLSQYGIMGPL